MPKDGAKWAGTPIVQSTFDGGDHQLWRVERETAYGADDVRFVNKASEPANLYLSVRGASKSNKAPLELAKRDITYPDMVPAQGLYQLFHLSTV